MEFSSLDGTNDGDFNIIDFAELFMIFVMQVAIILETLLYLLDIRQSSINEEVKVGANREV